jgi:hypothetical protein
MPVATIDRTPSQEQSAVYQAYRSYVQHEDDLIATRTNWFIGLQSFLFAGFSLGLQKKYEIAAQIGPDAAAGAAAQNAAAQLDLALIALAVFGLASAIAAVLGVFAATIAINRLRGQYREASAAAPENYDMFPDLIGAGSNFAGFLGVFYTYLPPVISGLLWFAGIGLATGHIDAAATIAALAPR